MDLEVNFSNLAQSLLLLLKKNNIKVETLTFIIANLPRSINVYVFPKWQKICKNISSNETLDTLFTILNMEIWNILDYKLLEYFIARWGNQHMKRRMNDYILELDSFKKNTLVVQFIECWEGHIHNIHNYEEPEVKFNMDISILTVADLDVLRKKLMGKTFPSLSDFAVWIYYKHSETTTCALAGGKYDRVLFRIL